MRFTFFIIALLSTLFTPFFFATAQSGLPLGMEEQLSFKTTPERPGPNTSTTIRIDSYSSNLNKATISWSVNGKVITKAVGANIFTFQTGSLGSRTTVTATIIKEDGSSLQRSFTFQPATVNLIFEANTYTPPFYAGKAHLSHHASYKVVAFPEITDFNGVLVPAEKLIYLWRKDFKPLQSQSGYGKNTLELEGDLLSQMVRIDVEVTALNSDVVAKGSISLDPMEPKTVFYENNPLYGFLFNTALLGNVALSDTEMTVTAFPYFYSAKAREELGMKYEWKLNNEKVDYRDNKSDIILRNDKNTEGTARVDVRTTQTNKTLQFSDAFFLLNFGRKSAF